MVATFVDDWRVCLMAGLGAAALCVAGSEATYAQGAADARITSGLYAGGNKPSTSYQHLDVQFDTSETFDTEIPARFAPALTPDSLQPGGYSTLVKASTNYDRKRGRLDIYGTGSGAARYYSSLNETRVVSGNGEFGLSSDLTRSTQLLLNQRVAYSPSYLYQLLPTAGATAADALTTAAPDYDLGEFRSTTYGTTVTLAHNQFAGGKFYATGSYNRSNFQRSDLARPDSSMYSLDGRYARKVSRSTELSIGYAHRNGDFGYAARTTEDGVPVGVTYVRALSSTRHADLSLTVTPERVDIPDTVPDMAQSGRFFRIATEGSFTYPFYRTWTSSLNASRRIEYLAALPQPVFSNRARAALEGFVSTRTHVSLSVSYSDDKSVLTLRPFYLEMYAGDALVRYALSRKVGVYGGYVFYRYDPRGDAETLIDIPSRFSHTGLRVGLMLFVPVMGR